MTKPVHIPKEPVSLTAAARLVTEIEGMKISRQGLTEYLEKHNVPMVQVGKRRKVLMSEVIKARENFTREVMRGQHIKPGPAAEAAPASTEPTTLDVARDAKARKEQAQAEKAELELARQKEQLVSAPAAEAAAASAMMSAKAFLIGPAIGQSADALITALDLPETAKREIEPLLGTTFREMMTKLSQNMTDEFSRLNTSIGAGLPSRLEILTAEAARLGDLDNAALTKELARHG